MQTTVKPHSRGRVRCFVSVLVSRLHAPRKHRRLVAALLATLVVGVAAEGEDKYAIVVGVERYIPGELPSLEFAEDDAAALGKALTAMDFSTIVMTSQNPNPLHNPTRPDPIFTAIRERLRNRTAADTVVIALSGHGVAFKADDDLYFCPAEARLDDTSTLVSMKRVVDEIGASKAGRKLLIVDTCRSIRPPAAAAKGKLIELDPAGVFRAAPPKGAIVLFSCRPGERSWEVRELGHSIFTHHAIEYLGGKAPDDRYPEGESTVTELLAFTQARTRETAAKLLGQAQNPEPRVIGDDFPDWPLGMRPRAPRSAGSPIAGRQVVRPEGATTQPDGVCDFTAFEEGAIPALWSMPRGAFVVRDQGGIRMLAPSREGFGYVGLPEEIVARCRADFTCDVSLWLNEVVEVVLQYGARTRRLVLDPRGPRVGLERLANGAALFPRDRPGVVRLRRSGSTLQVFLLGPAGEPAIVRTFDLAEPLDAIRFGIAGRSGGIARVEVRGGGEQPRNAPRWGDSLHDCVVGEIPPEWKVVPPAAVSLITIGNGLHPSLGLTGSAQATLVPPAEILPLVRGDFSAEFDIGLGPGGSFGRGSAVAIRLNAASTVFTCGIFRGQLLINDTRNPKGTDYRSFDGPGSHVTVRVTRAADQLSIGVLPLDGSDVVTWERRRGQADRVELVLDNLDKQGTARVFAVRVEALER